ncbi:MAG TPA: NAD-dependent epimerase/dehydratase family protein [Nitrospirales bacterium]|nr:NAD-dependent epimerase/dehydratase family protein [Nitrospirales bacterium]
MHFVREQMLKHVVQQTKVPLMILRPSLLYGAGDTHNGYGPNRFLRLAKEGQPITLFGGGEEKRDHVYVKDVSRVTGLCLRHRSEGILNVATGSSVSFFDIAQIAVRLSGTDAEIKCLPRSNPITHRHFDITANLKAFPSFRYTPMEFGLSETFKHLTRVDR